MDLEKRAAEYIQIKEFKGVTDIYGKPFKFTEKVQVRTVKEALVEFAQQEIALLSKHIRDLQNTNGALTDRVNELEKINAYTLSQLNLDNGELILECAGKDKQLTEAKEIIKILYDDCYSIAECEDTNLGFWEDDLAKAEAFLSEE